MSNNANLQLIIHKFETPKGTVINRKLATFERETREKFVEFCNLDKAKKDAISNRIHIDGSNIFEGLKGLAEISEYDAQKAKEASIYIPSQEEINAMQNAVRNALDPNYVQREIDYMTKQFAEALKK